MAKIKRGRFTISVNILMTTSLITRALTLGFIMMSIYIKAGDDILASSVIKVVNNYDINGIPYGTAVLCLVFSLIGVFVLDLITGIFGLYGAFRKNKYMLAVNVTMSSMLILVYIIYIVLFAIIYDERFSLADSIYKYSMAFMYYYRYGQDDAYIRLSKEYHKNIFPDFINQLGCSAVQSYQYSACYDVYMEKLESYLHTYFGLIVTCIICQALSMVAVEYIYRKIEVKVNSERISNAKYFLLCTLHLGMLRNFIVFIKDSFKKSKIVFVSVAIKLLLVIMGIGLLALGLIIVGNEFITDYKLRDIFYRLQFYNLYLYDIITGIVASCTVFGVATVVIASIGLVGSWRRSHQLLLTSTVVSVVFQVPRLCALLIWIICQVKINEELQMQLNIQQTGYSKNWTKTTEWNTLIQTLDCCGVNSTSETIFDPRNSVESMIFCYENANEILAYPAEYYDDLNNLYFHNGPGKKRTTTCTSKIRVRTEMMIGWLSAITLLQLLLEIVGIIFVKKEFQTYQQTLCAPEQSKTTETVEANENKPHNVLLFLLVCFKQFVINNWKRSKMMSLFVSSVTVIILMNFGILIIALSLRYDSLFGNRYINDYVFDDIVIAGRSFSSSIENFHIVVTTFTLVSFSVGIYALIVSAIEFKIRCLLLYLVILFMGILFIAHVIQIVLWGIVHSHVTDYLTSAMKSDIKNYYYADNSYLEAKSVGWNTLFIKGQCCGVESYLQSFQSTSWWNTTERSSAQIPIYCCKSETILYPYTSRYNADCTNTMINGTFHDLVCDEAIKTRLYEYSISFFVISAFVLLSQIISIITTSFNIYYLKKEQRIKTAEDMTNEKREKEITDITVGDDSIKSVPVNRDENKKEITDITVMNDPIISEQVNTDGDKKKRSRKKKRKATMESLPPIKERFKQMSSRKMIVDDVNEHNLHQPAHETTMKEAEHESRVNQLDSYSLNETLIAESKHENKINYISYNKLEDEHVYKTEMNMEVSYTKPGDDQRLESTFEEHPDKSSL